MVLAALAGSHLAQGWALADLRRTAQSAVDLQAGVLRAEMQAQSALPLALAADPEIAAMLAPARPRASSRRSTAACGRSRGRRARR